VKKINKLLERRGKTPGPRKRGAREKEFPADKRNECGPCEGEEGREHQKRDISEENSPEWEGGGVGAPREGISPFLEGRRYFRIVDYGKQKKRVSFGGEGSTEKSSFRARSEAEGPLAERRPISRGGEREVVQKMLRGRGKSGYRGKGLP